MSIEVSTQFVKSMPLDKIGSHHAGANSCSPSLVVPNFKEKIVNLLIHGNIINDTLFFQIIVNCGSRDRECIIVEVYGLVKLGIKVINPLFSVTGKTNFLHILPSF